MTAVVNLGERNLGTLDRYMRITAGSLLLMTGTARLARSPDLMAVGLGLMGGTMLAEGVLGFCPWYAMTGIDTTDEQSDQDRSQPEKPQASQETSAAETDT